MVKGHHVCNFRAINAEIDDRDNIYVYMYTNRVYTYVCFHEEKMCVRTCTPLCACVIHTCMCVHVCIYTHTHNMYFKREKENVPKC